MLEPADRPGVIRRMRIQHGRRAERLRQRLADGEFDDSYDRLTVEYRLGWNEWARDWCDSVLARLSG